MRKKLERQKGRKKRKNLRAEGMRTSFWTSEIVRHAERFREKERGRVAFANATHGVYVMRFQCFSPEKRVARVFNLPQRPKI